MSGERHTQNHGGGRWTARGCALVTGASRGIGAEIARVLADDGWLVAVNYRSDQEGARRVVADIEHAGGRAVPIIGDMTDAADIDGLFAALEERHRAVLVLVNNAGARADSLVPAMDEHDWDHVVQTNATAAYRTMRRAVMKMARARFGRIINVGSIIGQQALPGLANYAASKAALEALTRTAAIEVARRGITVNTVAPGLIETELTSDVLDLAREASHSIIPSRRAGSPVDVAACVRFLASEAAGYVTGSTLVVDGGLSAQLFPLPHKAASQSQSTAEASALVRR